MEINLEYEILSFDEQPILDIEKRRNTTIKDMLLVYLGFFQSADAAKLIAASVLAHKMFKSSEQMEVTKEEFAVINEAVKTPRHIAVAYVSMLDYLSSVVPVE